MAKYNPDIVVHTAWQIRELYGKKELQNKWNINGSHQVFDFVFNNPSVKKFIHFGSVASYGALASSTSTYLIPETVPLRKTGYLYADEKRISEEMLVNIHTTYINKDHLIPQIYVIRPASITGPYGRTRTKFSLQSILRGTANDTMLSRTISKLMSFMPITENWSRQFVHEDDIVAIIEHLSFTPNNQDYGVYNACPPGDVISGQEMPKMLGKKAINIPPSLIRIVFFFAWHITRGRIPTPKGSWRTYSYAVCVDGTKISEEQGYTYKFLTREAFLTDTGEYKGQI